MIIRGTTHRMTFGLPISEEFLEVCFMTVQQNGQTIIDRPISDYEIDGDVITAKLTQEETLRLSAKSMAAIKLVLKTVHGERAESRPLLEHVYDTSKNEVI